MLLPLKAVLLIDYARAVRRWWWRWRAAVAVAVVASGLRTAVAEAFTALLSESVDTLAVAVRVCNLYTSSWRPQSPQPSTVRSGADTGGSDGAGRDQLAGSGCA